jgi:inner membrane protein
MPFDDRWFYGDAVFIVDPWIWLGLGGALFLVTSRGVLRLLGWILGAMVPCSLVLMGVPGLLPAKLLFLAGLLGLAVARVRGLPRTASGGERLQQGALVVVSTYVLLMVAFSAMVHRWTLEKLEEDGYTVENLMVGPTPMSPFTRDVVFSTPTSYRHGSLFAGASIALTLSPEVIPRNEDSPLATRALRRNEVRGFAAWARFPWAEIVEEPEGFRVILRDARYARSLRGDGFGTAEVVLRR